MAPHSSTLAWKIPWTEVGSSELSHGVSTTFCTSTVVSHHCEPLGVSLEQGVCNTHSSRECMYWPS